MRSNPVQRNSTALVAALMIFVLLWGGGPAATSALPLATTTPTVTPARERITKQNAARLEEVRYLNTQGEVDALAWSPDGRFLAVSARSGLWLYDARDLSARPRLLNEHIGKAEGTGSVAFTRDGSRLASAAWAIPLQVWDMATGRELLRLEGRSRPVAFSPDGSRLVFGSGDHNDKTSNDTLWTRNLTTGAQAPFVKDNFHQFTVSFSPDGSHLASGGTDIVVWEAETGRELIRLKHPHDATVSSVAYSLDGTLLASTGWDLTVRLWDTKTWKELAALPGHTGWLALAVAFNPDGTLLASAAYDGVRVWDVTERQLLARLQGHTGYARSIAFSPDGSWLASGDDGGVRLWGVH